MSAAAPGQLEPEDAKLVTLARAARARIKVRSGAAVRDLDGRSYTGADVELPSLRLSALELAVAVAAASGAGGLEAAAVVTQADPAEVDIGPITGLGSPGVPVYVANVDGTPVMTLTM